MAVQNRTTYQANVDSLIDNTGSGATSGADVETLLENLSDSIRHKKIGTSLGVNPSSWDLENYDDYFHRCVLNTNTAIALSNSQDGGVYYLMVTKSTASDVNLTFTETGQTIHYPNGGSNVLLSGSSGDIFYINVLRKGSETLVANPMYGGGGGGDLVSDTTPQLGGDLDLNGNAIDFPTTSGITDVLDEDDLNSDSDTSLATQQSIKAYVDTNTIGPANNLSDVNNTDTSLQNLLESSGTQGTSTHSSNGTLTVDFDGIREHTLTLSANVVGGLTISNLPDNAKYIDCILKIELSGGAYTIDSVVSLDNEGDAEPILLSEDGKNTHWYIRNTDAGVRIIHVETDVN